MENLNDRETFKQLAGCYPEEIDISDCWLDYTKDYRRRLSQFKVNKRGDLLILRNRTKLNNGWEILIPRNRLTEEDWISHYRTKAYIDDFGDFVRAYFKALEKIGVRYLNVQIFGFDYSSKFADE